MDAVFIVATPFEAGMEAETRHGIAAADAAKAAGVGHLVYSSVANADKDTGIPHFDSKRRVEVHIEDLGVPYTIVAPVYLMDNLLAPWTLPQLKEGRLLMALPSSRPLQQITPSDIAAFTALVLENREELVTVIRLTSPGPQTRHWWRQPTISESGSGRTGRDVA